MTRGVTALVGVVGIVFGAWSSGPALGQAVGDRADNAAIPRMTDGRPDFSGVWWSGGDVGGADYGSTRDRNAPQGPSFTDLYLPDAAAYAATLDDADDPTLGCVPTALGTLSVRFWDVGAVGQIVSTPDFVVMLTETFHSYQVIPTDGRDRREVVPPSRRGDPIGRWEGDTFVVETSNFTDDTWMFAEGRVSPHSDQLRIVERFQMVDASTLRVDTVVEDPGVLREPWTVPPQTLIRAPFDQLLPLDCSGIETMGLMESASEQNLIEP
jgi:hypothetical protein